jgi:hypothetical protein
MKKIMLFAALIGCTIMFASCDNKKEEDPVYTYRIASFYDQWAGFYEFNYAEDGKLSEAVLHGSGTSASDPVTKTYQFAWDGTTCNIMGIEEGYDPYIWATITMGTNGYASSYEKDGSVFNFIYNADGNMISASRTKSGETVLRGTANIVGGDIVSWGYPKDDTTKDKNITYTVDENIGGIYNIFIEENGVARWLMETKVFGKTTVHLPASQQWEDSETVYVFSYQADENGCVTRETKSKADGTSPEICEYTWTKLKK